MRTWNPDAPSNSAAVLISEQAWSCLSKRLKLSRREVEIARAVLRDQTEVAIALRLDISRHTVHTHLERLYRKLDVASRVELVVCLAQCQLKLINEPDSPLSPLCGRRAAGRCPFTD